MADDRCLSIHANSKLTRRRREAHTSLSSSSSSSSSSAFGMISCFVKPKVETNQDKQQITSLVSGFLWPSKKKREESSNIFSVRAFANS